MILFFLTFQINKKNWLITSNALTQGNKHFSRFQFYDTMLETLHYKFKYITVLQFLNDTMLFIA